VGERIVLADFVVDTRGIVQGMRASDDAMARSRAATRAMGSTAEAAAAKLFSVRSAALKLAGAFGFAGVAFMAANAVAALTKDLISSTTWFKNASDAVSTWYSEVVKGEGALERLSAKLKGVSAIENVAGLFGKLEQRRTAAAAVAAGPNQTMRVASGVQSARGLAFPATATVADKGAPLAFEEAKLGVKELDTEINNLARDFVAAGGALSVLEAKAGEAFEGIFPLVNEAAVKMAADEADNLARALAKSAAEAAKMQKELDDISLAGANAFVLLDLDLQHIKLVKQNEELAKWNQLMIDIKNSTDLAAAAFGKFIKPEKKEKTPWEQFMDQIKEGATQAALTLDLAKTAFDGFVNSISQGLTQGGMTFKTFLADMLAALVPVLVAWGATAIIEGFVTRDPSLIAAGAGAFAAAVAAGAASRALGGAKSYSGGSSGGGGGSSLAAAGGSAGPQVTVVINGSVIGVGMSRDEFARSIAEDIERARGDGSR
jgi:hypothetical protein